MIASPVASTIGGRWSAIATDRKSGRSRAFLYSAGKMTDLGATAVSIAMPTTLMPTGQAVGYCVTPGKRAERAFLYRPGVGMKDLGTLGGSSEQGYCGINDLGQVVATLRSRRPAPAWRGQHAFCLPPGSGMKDLGSLGGRASSAFGINGKGQVVGDAVNSHGASHAFLYQPDGTMIDLNAAVEPAPRWTLGNARPSTIAGRSPATARTANGNTHAFLLTPQPQEPRERRGRL